MTTDSPLRRVEVVEEQLADLVCEFESIPSNEIDELRQSLTDARADLVDEKLDKALERSSRKIELYRCTECGKISVSIGWLHGHIEKHRPIWKFWKSGDTEFLLERTEKITVTDYEVREP